MAEIFNNLIGRSEVLIYAMFLTGIIITFAIRWGILTVKKTNGKSSKLDKIMECVMKTDKQTEKLLEMHDVKDQDGTPIWYVPRSIETSMNKLTEAIDNLRIDISKKN